MAVSRRAGFADIVVYALLGTILVCGGLLTHHGIDPLVAYVSGTPGHVTVSECHWVEEPRGDDGFECRGDFAGAGLHAGDVLLDFRPDVEPVDPVPALVIDANAKRAFEPGLGLLVPFLGGLFMLGVGLFYLWRARPATE